MSFPRATCGERRGVGSENRKYPGSPPEAYRRHLPSALGALCLSSASGPTTRSGTRGESQYQPRIMAKSSEDSCRSRNDRLPLCESFLEQQAPQMLTFSRQASAVSDSIRARQLKSTKLRISLFCTESVRHTCR